MDKVQLRYIVILLAVAYIGTYVAIALARIGYPFELEWMEGGSVDHVIRILAGEKIYVAPTLDFVPYIYTPLYYYVSALVSSLIGLGFVPLRLVSFLASLGSLAVLYQLVRREANSRFAGLLAAGLFAATFQLGGAWFDLARVDSLFLCLSLAGVYVVRFHDDWQFDILAGVLFGLSFLAKQTALFIALPMIFYLSQKGLRRALFCGGTLLLILLASTWWQQTASDGWYLYYIYEVPRGHDILPSEYVGFWANDILWPLFIAVPLATYYLLTRFQSSREGFLFHSALGVGMLGAAWFSRLHSGGFDNVLIPAYAALGVWFGLATQMLRQRMAVRNSPGGTVTSFSAAVQRRPFAEIALYLLCVAQFMRLVYVPMTYVPDYRDRAAGDKWLNTIAQLDGDVLVPGHGYLSTLAGKKSHAQEQAVRDVIRGDTSSARGALMDDIRTAIRQKKFASIILDQIEFDGQSDWFQSDIQKYYVRDRAIFNSETVFWPKSGALTRPQFIYIPRNDSAGP